MARLKPQVGKIKNLEDANLTLKEIGLLEHELEHIDAEAHKKIAEIKAESAKQGEGIRKRIVDLSALLGTYADYNREELFKDRKSIALSFGSFGYRKSTAISIKKTTLELLKKLGKVIFIRTKEEVDKEAMAVLTDEELAMVDAVRKVKDDFFLRGQQGGGQQGTPQGADRLVGMKRRNGGLVPLSSARGGAGLTSQPKGDYMFYKIKVLIVATMIYLFNTDTSAEGAVQQAKCVVREVDKQCKK